MKKKYEKVSTLLPRNKGIESKYLEINYRPNKTNYELNTSIDMFVKTLAYADIKRDRKRVQQVIEKFYEVLKKCNNINEIDNLNKLLKKLYHQGGYAAIFYESSEKMLSKEGKTLAEKLLEEIKYERKYGPLEDFSQPFFYEDEHYIVEREPSTKVVKEEQDKKIIIQSLELLKEIQKEYKKLEKKKERKRLAQRAYRARLKLKKLAGIKEEPVKEPVTNDTINLITELDNFLQKKDASLEKTTTIEIINLLESEPLVEKEIEEKLEKTLQIEDFKKAKPIDYIEKSIEEQIIEGLEDPNALIKYQEKVKKEIIKEDYLTRCEFAFNKVARFNRSRIKNDIEIKNLIEIHKELLKEIDKYKDVLTVLEKEEIEQEINNNIERLSKELSELTQDVPDIDLFI